LHFSPPEIATNKKIMQMKFLKRKLKPWIIRGKNLKQNRGQNAFGS